MSDTDLKEKEETVDPDAFEKEFGDKFSDDEKSKLDDLSDQVGKGYVASDTATKKKSKKWLVGGGAVAGVGVTGAFAFFALLPLKINHIVENVQDRFFSSAESATDRWSEKLFRNYIVRHVLPGMPSGSCKGTIDRNCVNVANISGNSPAARLYNGWKDARIETKLADKYGIEFVKTNETFDMKIHGKTVVEDMTLANADAKLSAPEGGGRKEVRRAYREALKDETKFKKAFYRFKVGNLLERKYGIRRCVFACDMRDDFADWKDHKKDGFKIKLVERVIAPRSENVAIVMQCIVTGGCTGPGDTSQDGERRDEFQRRVDTKLAELAAKIGTEAVEDLVASANLILEKGFGRYVVEKIVSKITNEATGRIAGKAVPVVGWIDLGAELVSVATRLGPSLKKMAYVTNAAALVSTYMAYRTMADEMKTGHVDPELLGSMVSSLSENDSGGSAEASPMYQRVVAKTPPQTALGNMFPSAYAAGASSGYICNDGTTKASDVNPICPEDSLKTDNFITGFSNFISNSPLTLNMRTIATIWNGNVVPEDLPGPSSLNEAYDAVGNALGSIANFAIAPIMDQLENLIADPLGDLTQLVADTLIPSPFPKDAGKPISGAKNASVLIGGGDEAGNHFTQYGLGGKALTAGEIAQIREEMEEERQAVFASMSFKDRVFNTENKRSLISQVAMSVPMDSSTAVTGSTMANMVRSPFSVLSSFGSFFGSKRVYAETPTEDPYGIKQYGIPSNDPIYNIDPETLTDEACTTINQQWAEGTGEFSGTITTNEDTGMDMHTKVNPCKLNDSTVTGLGAVYTDSVLEAQDRTGGSVAPALGTIQQGVDTSAQTCPSDPLITDGGIAEKHGPGRVLQYRIRLCIIKGLSTFDVNVSIAQNVANLVRSANTAGLDLTGGAYRTFDEQVSLRSQNNCPDTYTSSPSSCDPPTAVPGSSNHESGEAIDFRCNGSFISNGVRVGDRWTAPGNVCWVFLEANARNYGLKPLRSEAWHWSVSGG